MVYGDAMSAVLHKSCPPIPVATIDQTAVSSINVPDTENALQSSVDPVSRNGAGNIFHHWSKTVHLCSLYEQSGFSSISIH